MFFFFPVCHLKYNSLEKYVSILHLSRMWPCYKHVNPTLRWLPCLIRGDLGGAQNAQVIMSRHSDWSVETPFQKPKLIDWFMYICLFLNSPRFTLQTPTCAGNPAPTLSMNLLTAPPGGLRGMNTGRTGTHSRWVRLLRLRPCPHMHVDFHKRGFFFRPQLRFSFSSTSKHSLRPRETEWKTPKMTLFVWHHFFAMFVQFYFPSLGW